MKIKAVPVNSTNFKPFGTYYKVMDGAPRTGTGGWKAWMTPDVCMDDVAHFGFTMVKAMPFAVDTMERHSKTTELIVCGDRPLVLAVADSDPQGHAKAQDIKAFIISPGELVVMDRGIWHDACRCADGDSCYYYFLSLETDEKAVFQPVEGGCVDVIL